MWIWEVELPLAGWCCGCQHQFVGDVICTAADAASVLAL
jgi:hypothetical protein